MSPRSLGSSALLHALIILLVVFGLPNLFIPDEPLVQPQVIAMDLKIAPINNVPNRTPTPPKKKKEEPAPKPAPKKPEPKKEEPKKEKPKPEPKKPEPKKPEPKKEAPKKEAPKKEEPKKEEVKKEPPKKKEEQKKEELKEELSFEEAMKRAKEVSEPSEKTSEVKPAETGPKSKSDVPYDPNLPLSQTVENSIRNQIMKCWNYQGGAKDQETLKASILVIFREDGSIIEAKLKATDQMRYSTDRAFRSLVDSAMRATRSKCVPVKGLPVDQYRSWSKIELVFDPAEMW